jgi:hypothetical protein
MEERYLVLLSLLISIQFVAQTLSLSLFDDRQKKCKVCYDKLLDIVRIMDKKNHQVSPKLMNNFREINLLLKTLE